MCKNPFTNQNVCAIIKINNSERNDYSANESQKNNI